MGQHLGLPKLIYMRKIAVLLLGVIMSAAGCTDSPIEGTWQYDGGIYNGNPRQASTDFQMIRTYTTDSYEGHMIEGKTDTRYTAGTYEVKNDSIYLTSTFSNQPSQLLGRSQAYQFEIADSRLTIKGTLPNGMQVEEYWKKVE